MSPERNGGKNDNYTYSAGSFLLYFTKTTRNSNPFFSKIFKKKDIWSLGVTIAELAIAEFPLNQSLLMNPFATKDYFPKIEEDLSSELKDPSTGLSTELVDFIIQCVKYTPKERFDADKLLKTEFIKKHNPKAAEITRKVWAKSKEKIRISSPQSKPDEIESSFPLIEKWIHDVYKKVGLTTEVETGAHQSVEFTFE